MSIKIKGKQCQSCKAYLFEEDDVVFCPECGAPHHRECYNALSHCALEEFHGTDKQYKTSYEDEAEEPKEKEQHTVRVKCGMCGEIYNAEEKVCPKCQTPNTVRMGGNFIPFDFLGGVPAELDLGEGVKADEAKSFVIANTNRYIPRFAEMATGKRASFNLLAFFFPNAWLLSRKMYKSGILTSILLIAFRLLTMPFMVVYKKIIEGQSALTYNKMLELINENIKNGIFSKEIIAAMIVGAVLSVAVSFVFGFFGDYFYRNHTLKTVKDIKDTPESTEDDYRKKGGVNFILFLLGFFAVDYLPSIIAGLAGLGI